MEKTFDYPSMAQLMREHGENWLLKTLIFIVTRGLEEFKVKYKMEGDEVALFCDNLMYDYKHDTPEDIMMVMRLAKSYEFEENHHCVDGPTVRGWITKYMERKADMRAQMKQRPPEEAEGEPPVHVITDAEMADLYQALQNPHKTKSVNPTYEDHVAKVKANIWTTYQDDNNVKKYHYSDDVICTSLTELHLQSNPRKGNHTPEHNSLIAVYENEIERRGDNYKPNQELLDNLERIRPEGKTIKNLQQRPIKTVDAPADYMKGDGRKLRISYKEDENTAL